MKKFDFDFDDVWTVIYLWFLSIGSVAVLFIVVMSIIASINITITLSTDGHLKNVGDLMQLVIKESPTQVKTSK